MGWRASPPMCMRFDYISEEDPMMKVARFVLKIVALSLAAAAAVCAVIAYWDGLTDLYDSARCKLQRGACTSEYDDYEE